MMKIYKKRTQLKIEDPEEEKGQPTNHKDANKCETNVK